MLLIYCYVDIIQYNAMHKFVGVLDNPRAFNFRVRVLLKSAVKTGSLDNARSDKLLIMQLKSFHWLSHHGI